MILGVTGHRPNKLPGRYKGSPEFNSNLAKVINELAPEKIITGMALGVDQIVAELAIYSNIPFVAAIPCLGQDNKWTKNAQRWYQYLLSKAVEKVYVNERMYTNTCMQERNQYIVDNCHLLLAIWDESTGGTKNCIDYAKSIGRHIKVYAPNDLIKG